MNKLNKTLVNILVGATILSSGCMHYPLNQNLRATGKVLSEIEFDLWKHYYRKRDEFKEGLNYVSKEVKLEKTYGVERITLFSDSKYASYNNREIIFDYYLLKIDKKRPTVIILPIMGGKNYPIEEHFARYFAKKRYNVVLIHREQKMDEEINTLEDVDDLLKTTVADNKRVIDWLEKQGNTDTNKIGIFGISFGGIKGSLLMPLEDRIRAGVLGLVGGDLPYILAHTTEKGLVKHRERLLRKHNLSLEDGEEILKSVITYEPNNFADYINPNKVLLVLARFDTVIPYKKGKELRKNMGNPETLVVPAGHYSAVVFIPYIKSFSHRFFMKRFNELEK